MNKKAALFLILLIILSVIIVFLWQHYEEINQQSISIIDESGQYLAVYSSFLNDYINNPTPEKRDTLVWMIHAFRNKLEQINNEDFFLRSTNKEIIRNLRDICYKLESFNSTELGYYFYDQKDKNYSTLINMYYESIINLQTVMRENPEQTLSEDVDLLKIRESTQDTLTSMSKVMEEFYDKTLPSSTSTSGQR